MTKNTLLLSLSLLLTGFPLAAAPIVLNTGVLGSQSTNIQVPAGKRFSLKALYPISTQNTGINLYYQPDGSGDILVFEYNTPAANKYPDWLIGPGTVKLRWYSAYSPNTGGTDASIVYELLDINAVDVTPSNAVVIPQDANGIVQIILESSVDMVTWTAAQPGNYVGSTEKRFFRVRAVKQ